jgi:hypothetical protein
MISYKIIIAVLKLFKNKLIFIYFIKFNHRITNFKLF